MQRGQQIKVCKVSPEMPGNVSVLGIRYLPWSPLAAKTY